MATRPRKSKPEPAPYPPGWEPFLAAINADLDKFRSAGPEEKEVVRAQNGIETDIVNGLQRLGGFGAGLHDLLQRQAERPGQRGRLMAERPQHEAAPALACLGRRLDEEGGLAHSVILGSSLK